MAGPKKALVDAPWKTSKKAESCVPATAAKYYEISDQNVIFIKDLLKFHENWRIVKWDYQTRYTVLGIDKTASGASTILFFPNKEATFLNITAIHHVLKTIEWL